MHINMDFHWTAGLQFLYIKTPLHNHLYNHDYIQPQLHYFITVSIYIQTSPRILITHIKPETIVWPQLD